MRKTEFIDKPNNSAFNILNTFLRFTKAADSVVQTENMRGDYKASSIYLL